MAVPYRCPVADIPERFGNWNSIYQRFSGWSTDGTWARLLSTVQGVAAAKGAVEWTVSVDSTITCAAPPDGDAPSSPRRERR